MVDMSTASAAEWRASLSAYDGNLVSMSSNSGDGDDLVSLDAFYRRELPSILHSRDPSPFLSQPELVRILRWKLSRGKWRPRLLGFVSALKEEEVLEASRRAFAALPDLSKAVAALTVLKGVGPATASAVLAAYAPDVAPFMSDEAMIAAMGSVKDYTLKQYLAFAERLQAKAKELSADGEPFTPSDIEQALWSASVAAKLTASTGTNCTTDESKRKRKRKI